MTPRETQFSSSRRPKLSLVGKDTRIRNLWNNSNAPHWNTRETFSDPFFKKMFTKKNQLKNIFFQVRFSEYRKYSIFLVLPTCEGENIKLVLCGFNIFFWEQHYNISDLDKSFNCVANISRRIVVVFGYSKKLIRIFLTWFARSLIKKKFVKKIYNTGTDWRSAPNNATELKKKYIFNLKLCCGRFAQFVVNYELFWNIWTSARSKQR
jgi:hypothetical protein